MAKPEEEGAKPEKPQKGKGGDPSKGGDQPKGDQPKGEKQPKQPRAEKGGGQKGKKPEGDGEGKKEKAPKDTTPAPPPRLYEYYKAVVRPAMKKGFNYPNDNAVPKIQKVVLNMGV